MTVITMSRNELTRLRVLIGPDGLISRKRGGPSNRALGAVFRETVLAMVRERYADIGPTLAAVKLSEIQRLDLGVETLRQWMIRAGLWVRRSGIS